jgi:hypothetical protein
MEGSAEGRRAVVLEGRPWLSGDALVVCTVVVALALIALATVAAHAVLAWAI